MYKPFNSLQLIYTCNTMIKSPSTPQLALYLINDCSAMCYRLVYVSQGNCHLRHLWHRVERVVLISTPTWYEISQRCHQLTTTPRHTTIINMLTCTRNLCIVIFLSLLTPSHYLCRSASECVANFFLASWHSDWRLYRKYKSIHERINPLYRKRAL
jgi:hypothetical protein